MMQKKIFSAALAFGLAVQSLFGGITDVIRVKADVVYDLNWEMDKKGVYQNIPDIVKTSFGNPESWVKSGIYSYEFLDGEKKYITIRNVENAGETLKIPAEIDGYKVIGVGCWGLSAGKIDDGGWQGGKMTGELSDGKICAENDKIKNVVLPEGLEFVGTGAFYSEMIGSELCNINFPESLVYIGSDAFRNQKALKDISLPSGTYVDVQAFPGVNNWKRVEFFSDCRIQDDNFPGNKDTVIIKKKGENFYSVPDSILEKTQHIYLNGAFGKVFFQSDEDVIDDVYGTVSLPVTVYIERVYINNKKTTISADKTIAVGNIYTVPKASAIKFAKKTKTTYYTKQAGKTREVKAKKKSSAYQASWKKIKTTVYKNDYKAKKWKVTKTPTQTIYKVYGKKKKSDSYQFIKTTKKKSIKSEYKYIKAVPVKEWE